MNKTRCLYNRKFYRYIKMKKIQLSGSRFTISKGTVEERISKLVNKAGGEKDIAVYLTANENAIPFYEKLGMKKANDVMQYNHMEWTEFTVQ